MVLVSIKCPDCNSEDIKKNGKDKTGKQRYLCCNSNCTRRTFITEYVQNGRLKKVKDKVVEMALNGSGIRDTARVLKISPNTVLNELKKNEILLKKLT